VRTVVVEHEHSAARPGEDRAHRDDQIERRLLIGEEARENKWRDSPCDLPGRDRDQVGDPAQ
jgi:hypothetical protein